MQLEGSQAQSGLKKWFDKGKNEIKQFFISLFLFPSSTSSLRTLVFQNQIKLDEDLANRVGLIHGGCLHTKDNIDLIVFLQIIK